MQPAYLPDTGLALPFAESLKRDEKAFLLREIDLPADNGQRRRWQIIVVNRGDELVAFPRDLGPADPLVTEILILSLFEDEVAQLMDQADNIRAENQIQKFLKEQEESSTLIEDYIESLEQRRDAVRRNSRTAERIVNAD